MFKVYAITLILFILHETIMLNRSSFSNLLQNVLEKIERARNRLEDKLDQFKDLKDTYFIKREDKEASCANPKSTEQKARPKNFKFTQYDIWRSSQLPHDGFPNSGEEYSPTQGGSFKLFSKAQLKEKLAALEAEPEAITPEVKAKT